MKKKLRIGVIFGGRSAEHEVSLVSATSVLKGLDPLKYLAIPIGIAPDGRWIAGDDALRLLKEKAPLSSQPEYVLQPDPRKGGLVRVSESPAGSESSIPLDVVFPVIHGTLGEDGALQGLLDMADLPYVGAGVLGSAVGMDKVVQKEVLRQVKIPVTPSVWFFSEEYVASPGEYIGRIEKTLRYPAFVKPANAGSSVGITKAHDREELVEGILLASQYDRKILVEKAVPDAREIEVSVLGNDRPEASVPGEIFPSNEFYDYNAKYVDGLSRGEVPAKLTKALEKKVRTLAVRAFTAIGCSGMARVDFLLSRRGNRVFVNELNTIPGFTPISMYPKLWEASGLPYPDLLDRLVHLALERHATRRTLSTLYTPKSAWYR